MMKNIKNIICLLLCFALAFSLLMGCNPKDNENVSSNSPSSENVSSDETVDTEEPDDSEEILDDETDDEWNEEEEWDDPFDDQEETFEYNLEVYNSQKPIIENYQGFSGGIYHAYGFMKDDNTGRVYNDKMMDVELDRLQDTGTTVVRTRYQSQWMWKESVGYDWNSKRFNYFCDYAKEMQNRGIDVMIQVGWHFCKMSGYGQASINDVDYLYGKGADRFGESAGVDLSGLNENNARIVKGANRYGYWIGETLNQLRARGINNAKYLAYWVEPCNSYTLPLENTGLNPEIKESGYMYWGHDKEEYLIFCRSMRNKLSQMKLDNTVEHMGPNEACSLDVMPVTMEYILENDPTLFTIYSAHHYPQSSSAANDTYYIYSNFLQEYYMDKLKKAGVYGKVQFWMDEFNCKDEGAEFLASSSAWLGLQNAVCGIAAQQNAIQNILLWMPFDQLWTDRTSSGGEFKDGIHMCGMAPSLLVSSIPYEKYYTNGLFSKYNSCRKGLVYPTNNKRLAEDEYASVYIGAIKNDDGKWVISVVNLNADDVIIHINFEKAINATLYRHLCATGDLEPGFDAKLADADKTYGNVKTKFTDKLPGGSIAVYTEIVG